MCRRSPAPAGLARTLQRLNIHRRRPRSRSGRGKQVGAGGYLAILRAFVGKGLFRRHGLPPPLHTGQASLCRFFCPRFNHIATPRLLPMATPDHSLLRQTGGLEGGGVSMGPASLEHTPSPRRSVPVGGGGEGFVNMTKQPSPLTALDWAPCRIFSTEQSPLSLGASWSTSRGMAWSHRLARRPSRPALHRSHTHIGVLSRWGAFLPQQHPPPPPVRLASGPTAGFPISTWRSERVSAHSLGSLM